MDNCGADLEEIAESTDNGRTNLIGRAPLRKFLTSPRLLLPVLLLFPSEIIAHRPPAHRAERGPPSTYPTEMPNTISATCGVA